MRGGGHRLRSGQGMPTDRLLFRCGDDDLGPLGWRAAARLWGVQTKEGGIGIFLLSDAAKRVE